MPRTLNESDVKSVIQDIFTESINRNLSLPSNIVLVGGSAMAFRGIRLSSDIDMYVSKKDENNLTNIVSNLMPSWVEKFNKNFSVDITSSDYVFSESIRIGDIQSAAKIGFARHDSDVYAYGILDSESIFIAKCCSGREKDLKDLSIILEHTTPKKVINRLNNLIKYNNRFNGREATELVLASLQMETMSLVSSEWISELTNLDNDELDELYNIFGVKKISNNNTLVSFRIT